MEADPRLGPAAPGFYACTSYLLLRVTPPELSLPAVDAAYQESGFVDRGDFFPALVAAWALTPAQWQEWVPDDAYGLARVLPVVHARSTAEAGELVACLPRQVRRSLCTAALALARRQRVLRVPLPSNLIGRILALSAA